MRKWLVVKKPFSPSTDDIIKLYTFYIVILGILLPLYLYSIVITLYGPDDNMSLGHADDKEFRSFITCPEKLRYIIVLLLGGYI